jgi:hypothetical protein
MKRGPLLEAGVGSVGRLGSLGGYVEERELED